MSGAPGDPLLAVYDLCLERGGRQLFRDLAFAVLPGQAESVAWVTGRVDSMPAFLYFATFLAYAQWRHHRRWRAYAAALALFFVALFSKQNTITMVATLAAYDLLVLTHFDLDHVGGVDAVVGRVDRVLAGPTDGVADERMLAGLQEPDSGSIRMASDTTIG